MVSITAGERNKAGDEATDGVQLVPELAQAVVDEVNAMRRDPQGYAEELSQLGRSGPLKDCLHDLRSAAPMPELTLSQAICRACQQHLADLQAHGHKSHVGADGSTPEVRLSRVGVHREQCGENLAFGVGSAKDIVHQMLMDDGSLEHSQRANLLNPDHRFAGFAQGEHPSVGTTTVLLLTDHFRAKQASRSDVKRGVLADVLGPEAPAARAAEGGHKAAQRSWDQLMQQAKPAHLQVPPRQRTRVEFMANPKLYGRDGAEVPVADINAQRGNEVSPSRPRNVARTPPRYYGIPVGVEKMVIQDPPEKIQVRPDKTAPQAAPSASTKLQPWQEKQQQLEDSVNKCVTSDSGASLIGSSPCFGFEAQRKFTQILYMQKHGINMSDTANQQLDNEPDALTREVNLSQRPGGGSRGPGGTAARRGLGGSAPPGAQRGHGAGSHSLSAHNGVRSHFHNTVAIHSKSGSQNGLSALDVRWEGSHLDHTKVPPQKTEARFSTMAPEERAKQFSTHFKSASLDCAALKAQTASSHARDAESYQEWAQYEFRGDVPHRHGKHGRRHFDPQVREKPITNRHCISEIENKPQEEFERHGELVHDYLHRKVPEGQARHFQLYLPRSQQPSKFEELATHKPVRSTNADGVVKRHALGFGQLRHSGPGDPQLYTRPLGASHMDRLIPLA